MPIVIDGNNLLHRLPAGSRSRAEVRRRVLDTIRRERISVTLVFDGPPPEGVPAEESLGRLTVHYAGSASADDVILRLLPAGRPAHQWVVVTDDRGLQSRVHELGARVRSLAEWESRRPARRAHSGAPEPKMSARELAEWEEFFKSGRNPD